VIVFDDSKLTKWVDYFLLRSSNKNRPVIIIANRREEITKLEKSMGRIESYTLGLSKEDLEIIKEHVSKTFNVNLDKYVLFCLRDLVSVTITELTGVKQPTIIDEVTNRIKVEERNKKMFKEFISRLGSVLKEYDLELTDDIIVEVGIKLFGYSESTLRKNLARYKS